MAIVTIGGIPVYEALVTDDGTGMFRISLVDDPAVQSNFLAFDAQRKVQMYAVEDEDRRLVLGVVMRADFPIYRRDAKNGEYYVLYRAEQIRRMAEKYLLESRQNNVDLMHDGNDVEGVQMVQYFIKDSAKGIAPAAFADIADGSLFAEFHVVNDDIWAQIKDGTYKGFSLEGVFDLTPEQDKEDVERIVDVLDGKFNDTQSTPNHMSKLKKIRAGLARLLAEFGNVTTDKGVLAWDGEEDLKAGDRVYIEDQDGNRTDAADGDYRTEDGKTIVVENGQVAEIRDPEAEVAPQEDNTAEVEARTQSRFQRVRALFEESYEEKERIVWEAVAAKYPDSYVVEAADTYAVAVIWDGENGERYIRFELTWNEDGTVTLGAEQEVKMMFVPVDFVSPFEKGSEEADAEVEALRQENASLKAQVEQLSRKPAAKPAHEEVTNVASSYVKTGNKGLDNLARLVSAK